MEKFTTVDDLICGVSDMAMEIIENDMEPCSAESLGLDRRAGGDLYINREFIAVNGSFNSLEYYGGFEYVYSDHITTIGNVRFYSAEDERVSDHIDRFFEKEA